MSKDRLVTLLALAAVTILILLLMEVVFSHDVAMITLMVAMVVVGLLLPSRGAALAALPVMLVVMGTSFCGLPSGPLSECGGSEIPYLMGIFVFWLVLGIPLSLGLSANWFLALMRERSRKRANISGPA